jgi:hypothetical protein
MLYPELTHFCKGMMATRTETSNFELQVEFVEGVGITFLALENM